MKKIAIIAAIIFTTGVAAFALSGKATKTETVKINNTTSTENANRALATAD